MTWRATFFPHQAKLHLHNRHNHRHNNNNNSNNHAIIISNCFCLSNNQIPHNQIITQIAMVTWQVQLPNLFGRVLSRRCCCCLFVIVVLLCYLIFTVAVITTISPTSNQHHHHHTFVPRASAMLYLYSSLKNSILYFSSCIFGYIFFRGKKMARLRVL